MLVCETICASDQFSELKLVEDVKTASGVINMSVYIITCVCGCLMVAYAIFITYRNGKLAKLVEKGKSTISSLNMLPSNYSLVEIGKSIKRRTMENIGTDQDKEKLHDDSKV